MKHIIVALFTLIGLGFAQDTLLALLNAQADLSSLLEAILLVPGLAATLNALNGVTVLAPSNAAFGALDPASPEAVAINSANVSEVEALLNYHVIKGLVPSDGIRYVPGFRHTLLSNQYFFEGEPATAVTAGQNVGLLLNGEKFQIISGDYQLSTVTQPDIKAGGILVHKIDHVLKIPRAASTACGDFGLSAVSGAIEMTNLGTRVDGAQDMTIFVPSNEAFEAIGSVLDGISIDKLTAIMEYHVVTGAVMWSPTIDNMTVSSLGGPGIQLTIVDGSAYINTAHIVVPNIPIANGVAHVIDAVLNPDADLPDRGVLAPTDEPTPAWSNAESTTVVPFASNAPAPEITVAVPAIATTARGIAVGFSSTSVLEVGGAMPTFAANRALLGAGIAAAAALGM